MNAFLFIWKNTSVNWKWVTRRHALPSFIVKILSTQKEWNFAVTCEIDMSSKQSAPLPGRPGVLGASWSGQEEHGLINNSLSTPYIYINNSLSTPYIYIYSIVKYIFFASASTIACPGDNTNRNHTGCPICLKYNCSSAVHRMQLFSPGLITPGQPYYRARVVPSHTALEAGSSGQ